MLLMASYPSCTERISSNTVSRGSSSWLRICRDPARYRIASSVMTLLQTCSIRVQVPVNVMHEGYRGGKRKGRGEIQNPQTPGRGRWSKPRACGSYLKGYTRATTVHTDLTEGPLAEARAHPGRKRAARFWPRPPFSGLMRAPVTLA